MTRKAPCLSFHIIEYAFLMFSVVLFTWASTGDAGYIAYTNSECSDEPAHLFSLATTPAAHIHKVWKWMKTQVKRRHVGPLHSRACIFQARPYAYVIITKVACAGPLHCKHCRSSFTKKYPFSLAQYYK